jgi:hypothetical protein
VDLTGISGDKVPSRQQVLQEYMGQPLAVLCARFGTSPSRRKLRCFQFRPSQLRRPHRIFCYDFSGRIGIGLPTQLVLR